MGVVLKELRVERRQSLVRVEALLCGDRPHFIALDNKRVLRVRRLFELELLFIHQEDLAVELFHRVLLHGLHRETLLRPGRKKSTSHIARRLFLLSLGD